MEYIRTRAFNRADGKFSVWNLIFKPSDLRKLARRNPNHLTMEPISSFRVYTNGCAKEKPSIELLATYDDLTKVVKKITFDVEYITDKDENMTVKFTPSEPITVVEQTVEGRGGSHKLKTVTEISYFYRYDFLGYKPSSFYRLFQDVVLGTNFCTVDGTKYLGKVTGMPRVSDEERQKLMKFVDSLVEKNDAEYKARRSETKTVVSEEAAD